MANAEVFDSYFRRADLDKDGRISGREAVGFFQGAGLPQMTLAKVRPPDSCSLPCPARFHWI
jgi:epidermal growth factor receptor substrate 15